MAKRWPSLKRPVGGTCVNVGCVPKKLMWSAATIRDTLRHDANFDWSKVKVKRDAYIVRLNNIYKSGLDNAGVDTIMREASFVETHTLSIAMSDGTTTKTITAENILIATGGRPLVPDGHGIMEHCIDSDAFFYDLEEQPQEAAVVGAGFGTGGRLFNALGTWGTSPPATGAKVSPLMGAAPPEPTPKSKINVNAVWCRVRADSNG